MATVTRKQIYSRIGSLGLLPARKVEWVVRAFLDDVKDELMKGNRLEFRNFGVFETRTRASRVAQNPKTGERVDVPVKRTVKFKMGKGLRKAVNNGN